MIRPLIAATIVAAATLSIGAQAPKKAYVLGEIDVTNPQQYAEYMKLSPAAIEKFGGRFIARGGRSTTLEGNAARGRVVIVEFPSYERALEFYNSVEYQAARKARDGAATVQFVLVEGL
ncbi:MAG TPA: DUF1330 domain-containing protein [Vicinamibacterales bacterium]|nr:DUF1330 domain-containing protein [Vicinamibacterales bacterium]